MKQKIKHKILRVISVFLVINLLVEIVAPVASYALTTGPSQPEVQSFEPVGTTEMVDLFSGDFTYNIPLFELPGPNGGYPFNLHYNSGITMDQEASWVGLGWNLNPGAITRQMRGLPDEFNGNIIKKKMDMRPNVTFGVGVGGDLEILGADLKEGLDVSLSLSIYYNNYKGVGYSVGAGLSASIIKGENGGMSAGLGLDLKLDSQEGVGLNASLSFKDQIGKSDVNYNIGIGYSSRSGLGSLSLSMSATSRQKLTKAKGKMRDGADIKEKNDVKASIGGSSSISLSHEGYVPSVGMPLRGRNINLQFKTGVTVYGGYTNAMINGFFSTQYLKDAGQNVDFPAYGYLNLEKKGSNERVLLDYNREKDGVIRENSPNLGIPVSNPDIYSISAQGMAGTYRAFRNDIGLFHDTEELSNTAGGALGIEIGPGTGPEIGADVTLNYSDSRSGKWKEINYMEGSNGADFQTGLVNNDFEPSYFKPYGEHTADPITDMAFIGYDEPVKVQLEDVGDKTFRANKTLVTKSGSSLPLVTPTIVREPRNNVLSYIDNNPSVGMQTVGSDGTRYIYRQPALNTKQVECLYTAAPQGAATCGTIPVTRNSKWEPTYDVANTDKMISRTEIADPYAYAYLLTAVVGPDYIDADQSGTLTDADVGYWVKFEYASAISYKWRAPLVGSNYIQGLRTTAADDKGSYTYGEKEIFYLKTVQTKTHIAEFFVSDRKDGFGASQEVQQNNDPLGLGAAQKKLDRIELRSKNEPLKAIKTVNFTYTNKLCRGVENNSDYSGWIANPTYWKNNYFLKNEAGKLTLESVYFTYGTSNRGRLSPYTFEYAYTPGTADAENPDYNSKGSDRWGNFKEGLTCDNMDFPYVDQFNRMQTEAQFRASADQAMAVWNLKKITLPTGGAIQVQYEADDYAYVQNLRAMQMFKMTGFSEADNGGNIDVSNGNRKVYFDLEKPISNNANATAELGQYFEGITKLYWNVYMFVRKSSDDYIKDYVSGYNDIESWGFDNSSLSGGKYYRAYVDMKKSVVGSRNGSFKELRYHPFSLAGWQYIRSQNPMLSGFGPFNDDPNTSESLAMAQVKSLSSLIPEIVRIFQGFNNYADSQGWASKVITDKSCIRLNSPDKVKIGGGCRVKRIVLSDNWSTSTATAEGTNVYGQVYDYTITEGNKIISSGVAANEPQIGADENPLRKAKEYTDAVPLKTNNNLYFEYPVNESYYPGASVGYRKVTVKSLSTHYAAIDTDAGTIGNQNEYNIPAGIMTTGATTHEFYTAKEFPVISDETPIEIKSKKLTVLIPLIGQYGEHEITASQGYSIILNDMHGKLKKVSNYKQDKTGNVVFDAPISYVQYNYKAATIRKDGNANNDYFTLVNSVNVISGDKAGEVQKGIKIIGQDYEFYTDMREMKSEASNGGLKINTDVLLIGPITLPAFVPWPNASDAVNMMRTSVTNKIIHRSGILMETIAYDAGNILRTKNLYFDELTGQPILTSTSNDFDDPIYDYTVPAHFVYDGMGPAYKNIGYTFTSNFNAATDGYTIGLTPNSYAMLVPGDEFITSNGGKGVIVRKLGNNSVFVTLNIGASVGGTATIIRSGRRNLLSANASTIKTLGDATNTINPSIGNPIENRKE